MRKWFTWIWMFAIMGSSAFAVNVDISHVAGYTKALVEIAAEEPTTFTLQLVEKDVGLINQLNVPTNDTVSIMVQSLKTGTSYQVNLETKDSSSSYAFSTRHKYHFAIERFGSEEGLIAWLKEFYSTLTIPEIKAKLMENELKEVAKEKVVLQKKIEVLQKRISVLP